MNGIDIFLLGTTVFSWMGLVAVCAVKIILPGLSEFEIDRRLPSGDERAALERRRGLAAPRLLTLRHMCETTLIVLVSVLTVAVFGWILGTIIALLVLLERSKLARLPFVVRFMEVHYRRHEAKLLQHAESWRWLDLFNGNTLTPQLPSVASREELEELVVRHASLLNKDELRRFIAGLHFDDKTVKDVMTPRAMIESARHDDVIGPLVLDELHKTGHSRFPVIENDIDHIVGILYLHELLTMDAHKTKRSVASEMDTAVHYIHEAQSLEHALHGFLRTRRHLFIVVNDYRETVGVISLEDVLEALIGKKIVDEFDRFDDLRAVAAHNPRKNNSPEGKKDI